MPKTNTSPRLKPNQKLADALQLLKEIQDKQMIAIHTDRFKTVKHRQLLLKYGFIKEVSKGWYIASDPLEKEGETTSWYSAYWDFVAAFLNHKYGKEWCLSADQSLLKHVQNTSIPQQLLVKSPKGNNNPTPLPHATSLFNLKTDIPGDALISVINGIRMYDLPSSLVYCSPRIYVTHSLDVRAALSMIRDASEVLPVLLENGHSTLAGRLAGAFRNIGREMIADQIIETFKQADYDIREADPFESNSEIHLPIRERSPATIRIRLLWQEMRKTVIQLFPPAPGISPDVKSYLQKVDDLYLTDAYHSLSIERYKVSPELIARVSSGEWNAKSNEADRKQRDAMAARGYYQAFNQVKESIEKILLGANPGFQAQRDHGRWFRELFDPSVAAGLLQPTDLAGYRNHQVYIGNSKHVPINIDAMRDAMPVLFELLTQETEACVRAVLGHFIFVYIHPYMDGNGRMGRFLMNVMLASGGYPWTIIPVESRTSYMKALEQASVEQDITAFAAFIAEFVRESMNGNELAKLPRK
jgi:fido (protein-threonine AMPylation protein)